MILHAKGQTLLLDKLLLRLFPYLFNPGIIFCFHLHVAHNIILASGARHSDCAAM